MKFLMCGFAISLGVLASSATADQVVSVDGEDYFLSHLTANCQNITDDPAAQIACFSALSQLLEEQSGDAQENDVSVTETFEALRAVAEYQDNDSGLILTGSGCNVHMLYFNNYFHISRRNISSIDLFSAQFDASKLQYDQTTQVQGAQAPLLKGVMEAGTSAATRGGVALDSARDNFESRSPGTTIGDYANEVVGQLQPREEQTFNFVLVHPQRSAGSADIWSAFESFVSACKG